jgi:V/A-type H+-transporting ATPase subunit A
MQALLKSGEAVQQMMQVTGEEGVTLEDFILYHKAQCLDQVYLQQDAYDAVDVSTPLARQKLIFELLISCLKAQHTFKDKGQVREYFISLTGHFRNLNYSAMNSPDFKKYISEIEKLKS